MRRSYCWILFASFVSCRVVNVVRIVSETSVLKVRLSCPLNCRGNFVNSSQEATRKINQQWSPSKPNVIPESRVMRSVARHRPWAGNEKFSASHENSAENRTRKYDDESTTAMDKSIRIIKLYGPMKIHSK